jgi:hypothetical protein
MLAMIVLLLFVGLAVGIASLVILKTHKKETTEQRGFEPIIKEWNKDPERLSDDWHP